MFQSASPSGTLSALSQLQRAGFRGFFDIEVPHMTDQGKVGLPTFPKLIFFDTNIVQNLHSFGELIYDHFLSEPIGRRIATRGQRFSDDIFALKDFMALGQRAGWPIALSENTLNEVEAGNSLARNLWAGELAEYFYQNRSESETEDQGNSYSEINHFTFIQRTRLSEMLEDLPQESDRQLVVDAAEHGCDIFLTMDYKTIWRHKECVERLGIRVMRPVELLEHIRPWDGLLR